MLLQTCSERGKNFIFSRRSFHSVLERRDGTAHETLSTTIAVRGGGNRRGTCGAARSGDLGSSGTKPSRVGHGGIRGEASHVGNPYGDSLYIYKKPRQLVWKTDGLLGTGDLQVQPISILRGTWKPMFDKNITVDDRGMRKPQRLFVFDVSVPWLVDALLF